MTVGRRKPDPSELEPIERAGVGELRDLQFRRLQAILQHAYSNSVPYRAKCTEAGMFAVPVDQVVRIHSSSGTTGKPTVVGYTIERHRHLVQPGRALHPGSRRQARRQGAGRLRLWPFHGRSRRALRCGAARTDGDTDVWRPPRRSSCLSPANCRARRARPCVSSTSAA